jgi:DNA adenine methylase
MIFRYPGGKNKLLHTLDPFIEKTLEGKRSFNDVFVGGGSVLLHVAKKHPKITLHANDADDHIAAFWKTVASHRVEELCCRLRARPTVDLFYEVQGHNPTSDLDKAFRVIFLNRTAFSGLWHNNPIGGRFQSSRYRVFTNWTGTQLIEDIRDAHRLLKGRLVVTSIDGAEYVRRHLGAAAYVDPPYFQRGVGLYRSQMTLANHLRLAEELRKAQNWVLSYDDTPAVRELYAWAQCHKAKALYRFNQRGTKCVRGEELVIVPRQFKVDANGHSSGEECTGLCGV